MGSDLQTAVALSFASAAIALTVTESKMFRPVREWLAKHSQFLAALFSCWYCFIHWVAFALALLFRPRIVHSGIPVLDWLVGAFAIIGLTAVIASVVRRK